MVKSSLLLQKNEVDGITVCGNLVKFWKFNTLFLHKIDDKPGYYSFREGRCENKIFFLSAERYIFIFFYKKASEDYNVNVDRRFRNMTAGSYLYATFY